jgi:hypothetical protein
MQGIHNATPKTHLWLSVLLVGLLLLAPCKIRNSIESSLGMTTSKVSNKIKATPAKSGCAQYTANDLARTETSHASHPLVPMLPTLLSLTIVVREEQVAQFRSIVSKTVVALAVPLYILYRHFKVYL